VIDGADQAGIELTVRKQYVTHKHKFADVEVNKDNYLLTYRVVHDTETIQADHTYRVWPLTATVEAAQRRPMTRRCPTRTSTEVLQRRGEPLQDRHRRNVLVQAQSKKAHVHHPEPGRGWCS